MTIFAQLPAILRGAPVLPYDGLVDRFACGLVPNKCRFTLVRDPDRGDVGGAQPCPFDRGAAGVHRGLPQVGGVMLHPSAVGIMLWELFLCRGHNLHGLVENDGTAGGRALIDCKDMAHFIVLVHGWNRFCPAGYIGGVPLSRSTN